MSSEGDQTVFYNAVTDTRESSADVLFADKNYTFITDTTSSNGSFQSGMMQFDLSTLSSQSQYVSLSEAVIEFPVKVLVELGSQANTAAFPIDVVTLKNSFNHFIDGCQVIVNGQTLQSMQSYENVSATFKILSEWDSDTNVKYGKSIGLTIDDCTADGAAQPGLNDAVASTVSSTLLGFNAYEATLANKALLSRQSVVSNVSAAAATLQRAILTDGVMKTAGRHNAANLGGFGVAGARIMEQCYLATVRLKDIASVADFPLVKNLKGYVYISFNSTRITATSDGAGAITSYSVVPITGRSCPIMINHSLISAASIGNSNTLIITANVNADANNVSSCGPVISNARLLCPYYVSNPKTDLALSQPNKFFTSQEKIVVPITVGANQSVNVTLTSGVQNPTGVLMLPMHQRLGGQTTFCDSPEISPFDICPGGSTPFAMLNNLQVYCANKPIYQNNVMYDFEAWYQEVSRTGLADGIVDQQSSGLLSQTLWEQNHRFYYTDLRRRAPSEDGASRSIQVAFQNPSTTFGMKVICIVFYEKKWTINTMTCQLSSSA